MNFIQVFRKPGKAPYVHNVGCDNPDEATYIGEALAEASPEQWGEFLYARTSGQQHIELNEMYNLTPSYAHMRYRKVSEVINGPFDYVGYTGPHLQDLGFPLHWKDTATGADVYATVWFDAGKASKFWRFCKENPARFIYKDGQPYLQFLNEVTCSAVIEIPLERRN